jgi:hypothetical protein
MEEISLSIFQYPSHANDTDDNIRTELGNVDAVLERQQFSNLKRVNVRRIGVPDTLYPFEWFFDLLPLCHKRGILRMCETNTWSAFE